MLSNLKILLTKFLNTPIPIPWAGRNVPFWRKKGQKWYLSSWLPSETLTAMQYSLISLLAVAHTERLEPKPLIEAFAMEHRGRYRRRLKLLASRLKNNTSLVAALEKTPDVLSEGVVLAIRFGSQSGTLPQTYAQLLETEKLSIDASKTLSGNTKGYFIVLVLCLLILFPFMILIVPTLEKLADEFELKSQPLYTLRTFWNTLSDNLLLCLLGLGGLIWLVRSSHARQFFRRQFADKLFHSNSLSRTAQLFRMLSISVEAGRPLAGSLSTLAKYHFDRGTRQKLLLARNEVEQGVPAWTSLADAQLISESEFSALNSTSKSRVQSWMLNRMATTKQEYANQCVSMHSAVLHPLSVLLIASGVLWICYSLFSLLTNLIQAMAA